jgi:hypothetical protein
MNDAWRKAMGVTVTEKLQIHERFVVDGADRVFDTQDGVYYIRERVAVEKLNGKLEHAAAIIHENYDDDVVARKIRALKEKI